MCSQPKISLRTVFNWDYYKFYSIVSTCLSVLCAKTADWPVMSFDRYRKPTHIRNFAFSPWTAGTCSPRTESNPYIRHTSTNKLQLGFYQPAYWHIYCKKHFRKSTILSWTESLVTKWARLRNCPVKALMNCPVTALMNFHSQLTSFE